ncbi:MAG TPA: hypothetical protein VKA12_07305, partial [Roseiarcus sp.]|nr:hypothetical protein [Roseiarcus sp.]
MPRLAEEPRQIGGDGVIVEEAVRQAARQTSERFEKAARGGPSEIGEGRRLHEFWHAHQPPREFAEGRPQQQIRLERVAMGPVENEHRVHFARRYAVGETGHDEGAGTD